MAVSKENISATVDPENAEFLAQEHINRSGLINKLVTQYRTGGATEDVIREFRIEQLEDDADDAEKKAERKRRRAAELKAAMTETEDREREDILDAAADIPASPENAWVVEHADDVDMTPEEFAREIADRHGKKYDPFNDTDDDLRSL